MEGAGMLPNLKTALAVRDVRQIELARELNISPDLLSRIVRGWTAPSAALRVSIADFLDTDEGWLFEQDVQIPVRGIHSPLAQKPSLKRTCRAQEPAGIQG
jgi:transcriptional regulator with XRE-family HTH domain